MSGRQLVHSMAVILSLQLLGSCSIKEDRIDCPCILTVDISSCGDDALLSVTQMTDRHEPAKTVSQSSSPENGLHVFAVRKGWVLASVNTPPDRMVQNQYSITIPLGEQCDELYACSALMECMDEKEYVRMDLHKQFSRISLRPKGWDAEDPFPYDLLLESSSAGISLITLEPEEGAFRHLLTRDKGGAFPARIPRQRNDDLMLHVMEDGRILTSIPLGKIIVRNGYRWDDEDLLDISLEIDLTSVEVTVGIGHWSHESIESNI